MTEEVPYPRRAEKELMKLQEIASEFEYDKALTYARLVRDFIVGMAEYLTARRQPLGSPFVDLTKEFHLPESLTARAEAWLAEQERLPPTAKNVCRWHLKFVAAHPEDVISPYTPLIALLNEGGDFFEHHGAVCVRDAALIPFSL